MLVRLLVRPNDFVWSVLLLRYFCLTKLGVRFLAFDQFSWNVSQSNNFFQKSALQTEIRGSDEKKMLFSKTVVKRMPPLSIESLLPHFQQWLSVNSFGTYVLVLLCPSTKCFQVHFNGRFLGYFCPFLG